MVWPLIIMAVGTAVSAGMASQATKAQGREAQRKGALAQSDAFIQEEFAKINADEIEAHSVAEANNIKRSALTMRHTLITAQSGSGVAIGEGSAQAALDQIDTLASADTLAALYDGVNRSVGTRLQGGMIGQAGRNAAMSGFLANQTMQNAAQMQLIGGMVQAGSQAAQAYGEWNKPPVGLNTGGKK
jgi:hypothetical protein